MKTKTSFSARLAAALLIFSMLLSLAACGQAPAPTGTPDETGRETVRENEKETARGTEDTKESETKKSPSGTVKAGNLMEGIDPEPVEGKAADDRFKASQYAFAANLMASSYGDDGGNCLISPLSVVLALAMTANGAANNTVAQMQDVLGSGMTLAELNAYLYQYVKDLPSSTKSKLAVANSVWLNDRGDFAVLSDFLRAAASWYGADVYKMPFNDKTVKEINNWVSKNTDKMIKQIVDKISDNDRMFLINAVCFDSKWGTPFMKTADRLFTEADGSEKNVDMMYSQEGEYYAGENYTGFAKYYENGYKFVAILPDEDTSLDEFIAGLDGAALAAVLDGAVHTKVNIGLPKFSYDYTANLAVRLANMGMTDAFDDFAADFSKMSDTELVIAGVIHKTFIEVTEAGTRAAAVTAVTMAQSTAIQTEPPKEVILDRPFLYMIVDSENCLPIFIGTVNSVD